MPEAPEGRWPRLVSGLLNKLDTDEFYWDSPDDNVLTIQINDVMAVEIVKHRNVDDFRITVRNDEGRTIDSTSVAETQPFATNEVDWDLVDRLYREGIGKALRVDQVWNQAFDILE